jgi:hypothetical protein
VFALKVYYLDGVSIMVVIIRWLVLIFCLYLINDKCLLLIAGSVVYVSDCYNVSNTDYNDH